MRKRDKTEAQFGPGMQVSMQVLDDVEQPAKSRFRYVVSDAAPKYLSSDGSNQPVGRSQTNRKTVGRERLAP